MKNNLKTKKVSSQKKGITEQELKHYEKKLGAYNKNKVHAAITGAALLIGGSAGAATYFGIKSAQAANGSTNSSEILKKAETKEININFKNASQNTRIETDGTKEVEVELDIKHETKEQVTGNTYYLEIVDGGDENVSVVGNKIVVKKDYKGGIITVRAVTTDNKYSNSICIRIDNTIESEKTAKELFDFVEQDFEINEKGDTKRGYAVSLKRNLVRSVFNTNLKNLIIPTEFNGKPVLSIGTSSTEGHVYLSGGVINGFSSCYSLKSVSIPESVLYINDNAFYGCVNLSDVIFEGNASLLGIAGGAFAYCSSLANIKLPTSLKYIGNSKFSDKIIAGTISSIGMLRKEGDFNDNTKISSENLGAFEECTSLLSVYIPKNVKNINNETFKGCSLLASVIVDKNNEYFRSSGFIGDSTTEQECNLIVKCSGKIIDGLNIKGGAEVIFGNYKTELPSYVKDNDGEKVAVNTISSYAFNKCYGLKNITIPEGYTYIGSYAFESCENLTSVSLPKTLEAVSKASFENCYALAEIKVAEGNETLFIGDDGILYTGSKSKPIFVLCPAENKFNAEGKLDLDLSKISSSTSNISFANCKNLKSLNIKCDGDRTAYLAIRVFSGCLNLKTVNIDEKVNLTQIGNYMFNECYNLETCDIPATVNCISYYAFRNCIKLKELTIKNTNDNFVCWEGAFQNCVELKTLTVDNESFAKFNKKTYESIGLYNNIQTIKINKAIDLKSATDAFVSDTTEFTNKGKTEDYIIYERVIK